MNIIDLNLTKQLCKLTITSAYGSSLFNLLDIICCVFYRAMHFSAKRGLVITCRPSVRLSVTLVICDHIGWKSWKLIARTISPTPSLFAAKSRTT